MNVVKGIRDRLGVKLKTNLFKSERDEIDPIPLVEDDEENENKEDELDMDTAIAIMGESTARGYERIRKRLQKKKNGGGGTNLPSVYHINKNLPLKIENVAFKYVGDEESNNLVVERERLIYGTANGSTASVKNEEHALSLLSVDPCTSEVYGAKLEGGMELWLEIMLNKLKKKQFNVTNGDGVILMNCFDGAEAIKTEKELKGVISFSSQLLSPSHVQSKQLGAGSSFNILTWMQVMGKEDLKILTPCLSQYLLERRELIDERVKLKSVPNSKVWVYDVHDGKLLYLLTQHSRWNRRHHPYIMCNFKRGQALLDDTNHVCNM